MTFWERVTKGFLAILFALGLATPRLHAQAPLTLTGPNMQAWSTHGGSWAANGGVLSTAGSGQRTISSIVPFADMQLNFEYTETGTPTARLRLWTSKESTGGLTVDLDGNGTSAGIGGIESLGSSSLHTLAPGWHTVNVQAVNGMVNVRVDGQSLGSAGGLGERAGYVGFDVNGEGGLQVRNMKLAPMNLQPIYNGSDLSGWKSVAQAPDSRGGVGHDALKTFTFGMGGGSTKPHEAKWAVQNGAIHGEQGPGGLEDAQQFEDGIFQVNASMRGGTKMDNLTALDLRGTPGRLGTGYRVGIGAYSGTIADLANKPAGRAGTPVDETIVIAGRTIALWVNGLLANVHTDTRAENADTSKGAKTGPGALTILLSNDNSEVSVGRLTGAPLPKQFGLAAKAPPPPPTAAPTPVATTPAIAANAGGGGGSAADSVAARALVQQQQDNARQQADAQARQQRVAGLMNQALSTTDPQQQMSLYSQVIQLDPSNPGAVQGFRDAQAKVQASTAQQQQQQLNAVNQQQAAQTREQQTNASLVQAQGAFLAGHLTQAASALAVAQRLSPENPMVQDLTRRIHSAQALRTRLFFLGGGVGLAGLLSAWVLWMRRRKQESRPMFEVTRGIDQGQTYPLGKDLVKIGAVAQDGGQKNDIVIQDVEHAVSRFHCEVARRNGQLYVTDLNSSNGTRVDGKSIEPGQPVLLRKGSVVTLANNVDLRFGYERTAAK